MWVFALILAVPLIEIGLFVTLGGVLGLWGTLAFVLGSSVLGVSILRRAAGPGQRRGGIPLHQVARGGFSMVAALLLILPGFLTSALGLILLIPVVQKAVIALVGQRLAARGFRFDAKPPQDEVVEGEFTVVVEPRDDALPPSRWTRH
jgi:UPF0716 protein FxsA